MTVLLKENFIVDEDGVEKSLEEFLLENSAIYFSKKSIRKGIRAKAITVNEKMTDRYYTTANGDIIQVERREPPPGPVFELSFPVYFEDDHCAVIEKPPGYRVNGNLFRTIENALRYNLTPSTEEDALLKPRPVHRLDKATGGLLLVAKTSRSMISLSAQFHAGTVLKAYEALVAGDPGDGGEVNTPVEGRRAVSRYMTLRRVPSLKNGFISMVRVFPETGRTHQIRRHCAGLSTPIVGDTLYSEEGNVLRGKGLFLWSTMLSFRHPHEKYYICLKISAPQKFYTMMEREERRWKKYN